jgi:hypothetical protein
MRKDDDNGDYCLASDVAQLEATADRQGRLIAEIAAEMSKMRLPKHADYCVCVRCENIRSLLAKANEL